MVEPVNLRQFRKRKQREEKAKQADENRKVHGISTKLKRIGKEINTANITKLEGHKLDKDTKD